MFAGVARTSVASEVKAVPSAVAFGPRAALWVKASFCPWEKHSC